MEYPQPALLLAAGLLGLAACSSPSAEKDAKTTPAMNQPATPAPAADAAPAAALTYTPTPDDQRAALAEYSQQQPGTTPEAAEKFAAMFGPGGQGDYRPLYTKLLAGSGLPENDVAAAFAAYTVVTYQVAHGEAATLPAGPSAAVRAQVAPLAAKLLAGQPAGTTAQLGELMKLQAVLVFVGAQQPNPQFRQGVARKFQEQYQLDVNALKLTDKGLTGANGASATASLAGTAPAAADASPAATNATGLGIAAGAQWFFRSRSDAYGGITFEPVALLANGQYCDVSDAPLENLDAATDQARRPAAWGHWRKAGAAFLLTGSRGQPISYTLGDGSWFPAYAAGAVPLKRTYQSSSGGSIGGATSLAISKINFVDGSHFTEGRDAGVVAPNAAGGSRRSSAGTYQLQGHTLSLVYTDGRTVRKSFAIGAKGSPARPSNTLIFIGGDAYTDE